MAMSVLIIGGTGFLGTAIVDTVQEQHPEWLVTILDLNSPLVPRSNVTYRTADITDDMSVKSLVEHLEPEFMIHSAGLVPELAGRYGRELKEKYSTSM